MTPKKRGKGQSAASRKKTTGKPTVGELIPQPHGGALRHGGTNVGGPGRPPSAIREMLRGSIADRASLLTAMMDGEVMQRIEVPLFAILPHASCPKCGDSMVSEVSAADQILITIEGKVSASPRDRLAAWDTAAKYGLGTIKEVSVENVRERVQRTLDVVQARVTPDQYLQIVSELRPVWAS